MRLTVLNTVGFCLLVVLNIVGPGGWFGKFSADLSATYPNGFLVPGRCEGHKQVDTPTLCDTPSSINIYTLHCVCGCFMLCTGGLLPTSMAIAKQEPPVVGSKLKRAVQRQDHHRRRVNAAIPSYRG